jgi:hypothetical protein
MPDLYSFTSKKHILAYTRYSEYASLMVSEDAIGEDGYLTEYGLAPMTEDLTDRTIEAVEDLSTMDLQACADKKHPLKDLVDLVLLVSRIFNLFTGGCK